MQTRPISAQNLYPQPSLFTLFWNIQNATRLLPQTTRAHSTYKVQILEGKCISQFNKYNLKNIWIQRDTTVPISSPTPSSVATFSPWRWFIMIKIYQLLQNFPLFFCAQKGVKLEGGLCKVGPRNTPSPSTRSGSYPSSAISQWRETNLQHVIIFEIRTPTFKPKLNHLADFLDWRSNISWLWRLKHVGCHAKWINTWAASTKSADPSRRDW